MVLQRLARALMNSAQVRGLWQSNTGWHIIGLLPQKFRGYIKAINRRIVAAPAAVPFLSESRIVPWNRNYPLLSVVIPCYNYGRYIREALQSLQSQTFSDYEVIVVDDGSTEELTLRVLEDLRNEGVEVLRQRKLNVAAALNLGIRRAYGRYVCCLSADDTVAPTYFEKALCLLESNPGIAFTYSDVKTFGDVSQIWRSEPFDLRLLLDYNYICGAAVFRKSSWEKVTGFDESMSGYEDWEFWLGVGEAGLRGKLIPEPLLNYRRHGETLNVRSDRTYGKLTEHIKTSHSQLYSNPQLIAEIQRKYREIRVPEPFTNLNSKNQFRQSNRTQSVILLPSQDAEIPKLFTPDTKPDSRSKDTIGVTIVYTDDTTGQDDHIHDENQSYHLARFIDPYCWFGFVSNLVNTRSARFVAISSSILAGEWARIVRTSTAASVINVIREPNQCLEMSAQYDAFIDLHLVFSEDVSNSLTNNFGVRREKIRLVSHSFPNEFSTFLMNHEEQNTSI